LGLKIAVGCDHTGREHLDALKKCLLETSINCGIEEIIEFNGEDYPEVAIKAANAVSSHIADRGILICGTGIGMCIAANKVKGIGAAVCNTPELAVISRKHNNLNIMALGARLIPASSVPQIVEAWLNTDFEGGRHAVRLDKIASME
jgi:RpiB/LacA/LacB family sugar-phosphate isomerase